MDMTLLFWTFFVPALLALAVKGGLFLYAYARKSVESVTRLYMYLLGAFSLQNVVVIAAYPSITRGEIPYLESHLFYVGTIFAVALIFHLSLTLASERLRGYARAVVVASYVYALMLTLLILNTPWVISGYQMTGHIITRVPGPLYALVSIYLIGLLVASFAALCYGARYQAVPQKRLKNQFLLVAMIPMALTIVVVLAMFHAGVKTVNVSILSPILITYFLIVTAYATHQHRLFDIQFYIPWSKVRKRKTAFYDRVRAMITEVADLRSIDQAVERLAETLSCAVAFVGDSKMVAAAGTPHIGKIPATALRHIDQIVVRNEIADVMPDTYAMMKRHGVAAVVPFYPHSKNAASWLLLGDSFSNNVYTPLDFRVVEELFDKMADQFLDKLLTMRMELADARGEIQTLQHRLQTTEATLLTMQQRMDALAAENVRLQREQPADSLIAAHAMPARATVTLLGRDKAMLHRLRHSFPQVAAYASADSSSFRRQPLPDVLIIRLDTGTETSERRLLQMLATSHHACATLFYGPNVAPFVNQYRRELAGRLTETLPEAPTDELLARRINALAELRRVTHAITDVDYPLIGESDKFREAMAEVTRVSRLNDAVAVLTHDPDEAVAVGRHVHGLSDASGECVVLRTGSDADLSVHALQQLVTRAADGTLVIDNLSALPNETWELLLTASRQFTSCRAVIGYRPADTRSDPRALFKPLRPLVVNMPTLRERRADVSALAHYFTLQFNLQSGAARYLTQAEIDDELTKSYPNDLRELKVAVFERLLGKEKSAAVASAELHVPGRTLEECVSEFEARLIADALQRCGGNKSKAARLLGMRPNTLHYKMERYGLLNK
jgi:hypothetical protein